MVVNSSRFAMDFSRFPPDRALTLEQTTPLVLHTAATPLVLLFTALLLFPHRSSIRNMAFLPPILLGYGKILYTCTSRHWGVAFCVGAYALYGILQAISFLVVVDVGRDAKFYKTVDGNKMTANHAILKNDWKTRITWTISLLASSRGVGWGFMPSGIPTDQSVSLFRFLVGWTLKLSYYYAVVDAYGYYISIDPYFTHPACWNPLYLLSTLPPQECFPDFINPLITSATNALLFQLARKTFTTLAINAILNELYTVGALLFTILQITPPSSWPSLFGPASAALTLRGFWGVWWHQIFRLHFSWPGIFLTEKLGLNNKSAAAQGLKVVVAFLASGALHWCGCYTLARTGRSAFTYFAIQPVGMVIEGIIMKMLGKRNIVSKVVVAVWCFTWLFVTCDLFFFDFLKGGLGKVEPVPFSVVKGLINGADEYWRWGNVRDWVSWDPSLFGFGIRL